MPSARFRKRQHPRTHTLDIALEYFGHRREPEDAYADERTERYQRPSSSSMTAVTVRGPSSAARALDLGPYTDVVREAAAGEDGTASVARPHWIA